MRHGHCRDTYGASARHLGHPIPIRLNSGLHRTGGAFERRQISLRHAGFLEPKRAEVEAAARADIHRRRLVHQILSIVRPARGRLNDEAWGNAAGPPSDWESPQIQKGHFYSALSRRDHFALRDRSPRATLSSSCPIVWRGDHPAKRQNMLWHIYVRINMPRHIFIDHSVPHDMLKCICLVKYMPGWINGRGS
jgi:hypothetical protein